MTPESSLAEDGDGSSLSHRRWALRMQQPVSSATVVDRVFFLFGTAASVFLAVLGSVLGVRNWWSLLMLIPVWAVVAYLAVPRLHRLLSDFYVPDYFFGRTRTTDGLLGDPVNLAVDGEAEQLDAAMLRAGWYRADPITPASAWGIVASTLTRRSYPTAPVSPLTLFGRRQDVAYQQEVAGNPKQRHHVRFWHTPSGWLLPGGAHVDWLGAGTYDTNVGLSLFTFQVTHRIDENTDIERDYIIDSVTSNNDAVVVRDLPNFTTGYHSRNGGGDQFITDGNLPILDLNAVDVGVQALEWGDGGPAALEAGAARESGDAGGLSAELGPARGAPTVALRRAPVSIVVGVGFALFATALSIVLAVLDIFGELSATFDPDYELLGRCLAVGLAILVFLVEVLLVRGVLRRGSRSRLILMSLLAAGVIPVAFGYITGESLLRYDSWLLFATLQCLALIALSSTSSAAWVRDQGRGQAR